MRKREQNKFDLTNDEVTVLRGSTVPSEVKAFLSRSTDTVGARILAYEKVAAAARAERLALQEIRRLYAARDAITETSEWRQHIVSLETEKDELLSTNDSLRQRIMQATATPALAVHSSE